ncbi:MAG TPA: sugar nucleotide-binding protein [Thermoplasmata archaeon]|nr:sugar nucleotide-binding protein [Thermoplasmata archaeon]
MTEVLLFGATSLVGSHFAEESATELDLTVAGRRAPRGNLRVRRFEEIDVTDLSALRDRVRSGAETVVVNFAARTDVDGVERERPAEVPTAGVASDAFRVNALAPEAMAQGAASAGKAFVTISTDFVFDGRRGPYAEEDRPDPFGPEVSWYGWTKGEGERRVRDAHPGATILRISYPFRPPYDGKPDFAGWIRARAASGGLPPMYTDQQITPTWIPDVTRTLRALVAEPRPGTIHIASPTPTTPFEFASYLLGLEPGTYPPVVPGSLAARLREPGVTPRPIRGGLRLARVAGGPAATPWDAALRMARGVSGPR